MLKKDLEEILDLCKAKGVKRVKQGTFEAEFFEPKAESMALDTKSLIKTLSDSLPPDSAMLFASTEEVNENPISEKRETTEMN